MVVYTSIWQYNTYGWSTWDLFEPTPNQDHFQCPRPLACNVENLQPSPKLTEHARSAFACKVSECVCMCVCVLCAREALARAAFATAASTAVASARLSMTLQRAEVQDPPVATTGVTGSPRSAHSLFLSREIMSLTCAFNQLDSCLLKSISAWALWTWWEQTEQAQETPLELLGCFHGTPVRHRWSDNYGLRAKSSSNFWHVSLQVVINSERLSVSNLYEDLWVFLLGLSQSWFSNSAWAFVAWVFLVGLSEFSYSAWAFLAWVFLLRLSLSCFFNSAWAFVARVFLLVAVLF